VRRSVYVLIPLWDNQDHFFGLLGFGKEAVVSCKVFDYSVSSPLSFSGGRGVKMFSMELEVWYFFVVKFRLDKFSTLCLGHLPADLRQKGHQKSQ
jgi:hypothetical protein